VLAGGNFIWVYPPILNPMCLFLKQRQQLFFFICIWSSRKRSSECISNSIIVTCSALFEGPFRQCLSAFDENRFIQRRQGLQRRIRSHSTNAGEVSIRCVKYLQDRVGG